MQPDSADSSEGGLHHYASCNDCPLYEWTDTAEDAREKADGHEEKFPSHSAYTGATDVIR